MKSQRVLAIIITLILVGGLAWYFDRNYISKVSDTTVRAPEIKRDVPTQITSDDKMTKEKLLYYTGDHEIIKSDWQGKDKKVIFTDKDEALKIQRLGNLAFGTSEIIAIMGDDSSASGWQLVAIKADGSGKKEVLNESFGRPNWLTISPDGQSICFISFSNVEADYGYILYQTSRKGANLRKIVNSDQEIKNPLWSPDSSKIYYLKENKIYSVDIGSLKEEKIFPNDKSSESVDAFNMSGDKIIYTNGSGVIQVDLNGSNPKGLAGIVGGVGLYPYVSSDQKSLAYLLTVHWSTQDLDVMEGKIILAATKDQESQEFTKGLKVLGWVK